MNILIIVAMEKEAVKIIEQLGLNEAPEEQQFLDESVKVYHRKLGEHNIPEHTINIWLILSGKDPVHENTDCIGPLIQIPVYNGLRKFEPDIIINAGTAGAFYAAGAEKHKVYLGNKAVSHDLHFPESDPKHRALAIGNYPVPDESALAKKLGYEWAALSTTGSMEMTEKAKQQLQENEAILVDMEWKYIVFVILKYVKECAKQYSQKRRQDEYTPRYMAVKVTTDFIDLEGCSQKQFAASMAGGDVQKQLADACQKIIEEICQIKLLKKSVSNASPRFLKSPLDMPDPPGTQQSTPTLSA